MSKIEDLTQALADLPSGTEEEPEHIFALLLTREKRVIYESNGRMFHINGESDKNLTPTQDQIFTTLLRHPQTVIPYTEFYFVLNPDDVRKKLPYEEAERLLRPQISKLRTRMDEVDERLRAQIQTIKQEGLVYIPHESTMIR